MPKGERHSGACDAKALAKRATTKADKGHLLKLVEAWLNPRLTPVVLYTAVGSGVPLWSKYSSTRRLIRQKINHNKRIKQA